jgi:hypothetical protein
MAVLGGLSGMDRGMDRGMVAYWGGDVLGKMTVYHRGTGTELKTRVKDFSVFSVSFVVNRHGEFRSWKKSGSPLGHRDHRDNNQDYDFSVSSVSLW